MHKKYTQPRTYVVLLAGQRPFMDIYSLDGAQKASQEGNPPMDAKENPHHYNVWDDDWQKEEKGGPL